MPPEHTCIPPCTQILNDSLDEYNVTFANQMNIVFFADAVVHVTRIGRVLRQPRGNAMLVGVGGSGKQSLTRVASFVAGYECVQIEINRGYGLMEFREDIKKLMVREIVVVVVIVVNGIAGHVVGTANTLSRSVDPRPESASVMLPAIPDMNESSH